MKAIRSQEKYTSIAGRYAVALFQLAIPKEEKKVEAELQDMVSITQVSPVLTNFLKSGHGPESKRQALVQSLAEKRGWSSLTQSFLYLLGTQKRINLLEPIANLYAQLVLESHNIERVDVFSAYPLTTKQKEALKQQLTQILEKNVHIEYGLDETMLEGIALKVKGHLVSATLKGYLQGLQQHLKDTLKG